MERGTLFQLKNLLNRSAVPSEPDKNMKSAEDFLELVVTAHIVVAAQEQLKKAQSDCMHKLAETIVDRFVELGEGTMKSGSETLCY